MAEPARVDLSRIAQDLQIRRVQVEAVVALLDEGNTIPFIARYRRERTGGLDEETIRRVHDRAKRLRVLADRKGTVLRSIQSQGKLTDELRGAIQAAETFQRLEDLYLPFKPKKRTPAAEARDKGLEPLARAVWQDAESARDLSAAAQSLVDPAKGLNTADDVLAGVAHIVAEEIAENATARGALRKVVWDTGKLTSGRVENVPEEKGAAYRDYTNYQDTLVKVPAHRVLGMNRGEKDRILKVRLALDDEAARQAVHSILPADGHTHLERLRGWASHALSQFLLPGLEREVRRELTEESEEHSVHVLARNLRCLMLQQPVRGKRVLAIEPGFRTGCKLAVIDETGKLLAHAVIHVHAAPAQRAEATAPNSRLEAKETLVRLAREHQVQVIAIGDGSACRETEELVAEIIAESMPGLAYTIVSSVGASDYATSAVGREELPDLDATLRAAVSVGRRLQDPLSELAKIDPQHLTIGAQQHDVAARHLKEALGAVVESCINEVGVDLNTAGVHVLRYVPGLNQLTARRLVEWRQAHGAFQRREQIKEISEIGDGVFMQAAGFLKISGGQNPLDGTWIHPECYGGAEQLLAKLEFPPSALAHSDEFGRLRNKLHSVQVDPLAQELQVSAATLRDIIDALRHAGHDPRDDSPPPIFKQGVQKLEDLTPGKELRGKVLNVVDFGAFVDIGLKDSGLVHVSQLSTRFIRSPHDAVTVGQVVTVWVLAVDGERRRVSLTMIPPGSERRPPHRARKPPHREGASQPAAPATGQPAMSTGSDQLTQPQESRPSQGRTAKQPPARPPQPHRSPQRKPRPQPPAPLPESVLQGQEPMRSFGELKRLWEAKRKT
jgi:uncharacterized protein